MWGSPGGYHDDVPSDPRSQYATLATGEDDADEQDQNQRVIGEQKPEEEDDDILRPGDHVFVWLGFSSQRHGIVLEAPERTIDTPDDEDEDNYGDDRDEYDDITILTFYENSIQNQRGGLGTSLRNLFRKTDIEEDAVGETPLNGGNFARREIKKHSLFQFQKGGKKVQKVKYGVTVAKRVLSRGGTATSSKPDSLGLIMARINYLLEHPEILPEYKKLSANDECVAVWCRTGRWITLQGASMLEIISASQAGSAIVAGSVASQMMVTYTMPWIPGYVLVWSVPATVAYPVLVPLFIGYGLTSLVPLEILRRHRKKWKETSDLLNRDFWSNANEEDRMEYFGGSMDARNDDLARFFGCQDDEDAGKYMPLNTNGTDGDGDDDGNDDGFDSEDEDSMKRHCNQVHSTMGIDAGASSSGRNASVGGASSGRNDSMGMFGGIVSKVRKSFRNINDSLKEYNADDSHSNRLTSSQERRYEPTMRPDETTLL
mmetsp:Transcript_28704/g.34972  ORF Transcript_28704/g.34972 Transcript_28704/m.34972 type:complete len:487 (+) Transcript_28704:161-1621(+)|eukprot:CAMPEP_0172509756 /NCGR_PEP_ID=MMETSP1066-20121228/222841_1 /TAXON_ID=671091 /ORGANISM="Coscinodiscus wailesii, Strain CCMP2513" /LENGTH=486 /DNA_ID=CAMNT_0013288399 /DNA_START=158 /DNA_END=1618 /DNA_ORIENTATION=+